MPVKIATSGNVARIRLIGDFDFSAQDVLKQAFDQLIETPETEVEVDMAETNFIDSSVIRMFLKLSDAVRLNKKSMSIVNCNDHIREIFSIGGFDQIFDIA